MSFKDDIAAEKVKMYKSVYKSKLGKHITDKILSPLLDTLGEMEEEVYNQIGQAVVAKLEMFLKSSQPRGAKYQVREAGAGKGRKARVLIQSYIASAPGQPPGGNYSGTMHKSVSYKLRDGHLVVGVLSSPGTEFHSTGYVGVGGESGRNKKMAQAGFSGIIYVKKGSGGTPVTTYANLLDKGYTSPSGGTVARPWFNHAMKEMRPYIRKMVRDKMKEVVRNSKVAAKGGEKALVFKVMFTNYQKGLADEDSSVVIPSFDDFSL